MKKKTVNKQFHSNLVQISHNHATKTKLYCNLREAIHLLINMFHYYFLTNNKSSADLLLQDAHNPFYSKKHGLPMGLIRSKKL